MPLLKVLHPITRLIVGGAQENTMYTAALLDGDRFRAEIISGPQTGSEGSLIEAVRAMGVRLEIVPELVRQIAPQKDAVALWKLYARMKKDQAAIVHTHSSKAGILGRLAARLAGVPLVVHTVHGWSFHDRMHPFRRGVYVALERLCARFSDALIVVARRDMEKGLRHGIGRPWQYVLIRSAIPLDAFDPALVDRAAIRRELGLPEDAPVLGNVGRFSPQKNPLDWVRVARLIVDRIPNCRFLLVGDGPMRPQTETLLSELGLDGRTVLTGLRRDVDRMMAAMDVFLLTSLWEGLPRVIPQAMSMDLPVVATRADGTAEAIDHGVTGYLCEPGDLPGMADYCSSLLQNPSLRRQMGERGRAFARQEFDLREMIAQIESLYDRLLSNGD